MLTCPNAELLLCMTAATAAGQGAIRAHFGRDTCKESDAVAQGRRFILEHRRDASAPSPPPALQLSFQGCFPVSPWRG